MSKDLEFETNDEGEMVDAEGETIYCENLCCESPATERVVVSVNKPHDEIRNYCDGCQAVYMIGVQHGASTKPRDTTISRVGGRLKTRPNQSKVCDAADL